MEPWTEERVRSVLDTVATLPEAQQGMFGAKLGALLRRVAPDFSPGVLGDRRLKVFSFVLRTWLPSVPDPAQLT